MTAPVANTSFQTGTALQIAWDSTSIGALKKCPRYYQLSIVLGYTPRLRSVDLDFGIWLHSARERYYHARARGEDHDTGVDAALDYALRATWNSALGRPWISDHPQKNRATLIRTIVWYLDKWAEDPLETLILANGKPAVELSFMFQIGHTTRDGVPYQLCGHIDRLVKFQNSVRVSDLKSTKHTLDPDYFSQFIPDNQMETYSFASRVIYEVPCSGIIIDAAQVAVSFSRFGRGFVSYTDDQIDEWYEGLGDYLAQAETYALRGRWPMNERACFRCEFRGVCAKPPSTRDEWLRGAFDRRVWDPLQRRGDI